MAARSLTSGRGSNQYRTRPRPQLQMPPPVNTGKSLRRCDEIWDDGTAGPCAHLVGPPSWSHHAHPGLGARILAARHTKLPWLRQLLTQDRNPVVRMQISESPDCPARILGQMAHDTSANVRLTVAANPPMPQLRPDTARPRPGRSSPAAAGQSDVSNMACAAGWQCWHTERYDA